MSRVNYGTVEVTVCDETYTLKPTLKAMDKIQSRFQEAGGLRGAIAACSGMGARDLAFIVAAGAGMGQREAKDLPESVFQEGSVRVAVPVLEYLMLLINPTGREDDDEDESREDDESGE